MAVFVGIDVGGTFTDLTLSRAGGGGQFHHKVPSTPEEPDAAIVRGLRELLREHAIAPEEIVRIAHGTTVGTNALIQRRVGTVALVTTQGFRDLLEIRRQTRPRVYDIHLDYPPPLVPRQLRFEVRERMRADGGVHVPLDEVDVARVGRRLRKLNLDCVAVCFLHAHRYPRHEQRAAAILRLVLGERVPVIASSSVYPEFREYERFSTTVLNAALLTVLDAYLGRFARKIYALGIRCGPMISQSAGGLMSLPMARAYPIRTALSGPAAGAMGAAVRARAAGFGDVITLDVGGTSADVSLLAGGQPQLAHARLLAGFPLRLPSLDVNAVGAGGGSISWIDRDGLLKVGPHSAGARPGPACYGIGGDEATVTDANVLLGRLHGEALLDGRMPIERALAKAAIDRLAHRLQLPRMETAFGIVRLVAATMVKAIRTISIERGHDPSRFALFAFGGAGPLHAHDVARELDIGQIIVPPHPGILCAQGLLDADLVSDDVQTGLMRFEEASLPHVNEMAAQLEARAQAWFEKEAVPAADRRVIWSVDLRYPGQNFELSVPCPRVPLDPAARSAIADEFHAAHDKAFGFSQPGERLEFVSLRVKLIGVLEKLSLQPLPARTAAQPRESRQVGFTESLWCETPVYKRDELAPGQRIDGPAILEQMDSTAVVFPGDRLHVDQWGNLVITLAGRE